ncbi:MAG: hydratase [Pseudonocardiaceae bacterium]|nr:hydratase [Pseudonocardiaceae bacterium]
MNPEHVARTLLAARRNGHTLDPLTDRVALTLEQAYRVQDAVTAERLRTGQRMVGWKLGYTSAAMRAQMGITEPNCGPLTDAMLIPDGGAVPLGLLQPRVEPEIGLRLRRRLAGSAGVEEVLDACETGLACLEVVDSVFTGYRFRLEDNTADGSSAAGVVVGDELPLDGLDALAVRLERNGEPGGEATGAAAGGHPAAGVGWLAARLAQRGHALEPGQLVITGGLTAAVPLEPGDEVCAVFAGSAPVSVRRTR